MNKQPFYHSIEIVFTTTSGIESEKLEESMKNRIVQLFKNREYGLLKDSVMVSCAEPEAGDPQDLM